MRLWFCSSGCREAADAIPRPWPFVVHDDRCVTCHAPRPDADAFLIAKADMGEGYERFTAEPLIIVGDYVIVRVDAAWKHAAWEHIASGLQLGAAEMYASAPEAWAAAQDLMRRYGGRQGGPRWAAWQSQAKGVGWDLQLSYLAAMTAATPVDGATYRLWKFENAFPVERTGGARTFRALHTALKDAFPGRFRAVLANAWVSLGLA